VCTKSELQPVDNSNEFHLSTSNTREGARLDIAMNSLWGGRSERCFVDAHVFNPLIVPPCFLPPLRNMRMSSVELMVREFVRLSMLLLHLSSCRQLGGGSLSRSFLQVFGLSLIGYCKWGDEYSVVLGWL